MKKFIIRTYLIAVVAAGFAFSNAQAADHGPSLQDRAKTAALAFTAASVQRANEERVEEKKTVDAAVARLIEFKRQAARELAAIFFKYYREKGATVDSFLFCVRVFDLENNSFTNGDWCTRNDKVGDHSFFTPREMLNNPKDGSTPLIRITYNLLDGNTVERTYQVALSDNGKAMFVIAPEDKLEVADLAIKSKDFVVEYKPVPESDEIHEMYIPMPMMKDGKVNMIEFGDE